VVRRRHVDRKTLPSGLEPKTVVNTHRMLHRAWEDFEIWGWAKRNVVADAHPPRVPRKGRKVWNIDQLRRFLQHVLALDPFTFAVLRAHVEMLDQERKDFGPDYRDDGWLFCWENGKPPHPDRITRRFKKLARAAGLPEIDLHDVRYSYATAGRNAKIDWKALSKRIGHADVAFTMKQYVQTDLEADREVANTLTDLIIGGLLVTDVDDQADAPDRADET
jgi:Phage integrase family